MLKRGETRPISKSVSAFFENAQRIFDVARADIGGDASDFTLLVRPDGSLHMLMEQTVNPDSAALAHGAQAVYRVSRSRGAVTVSGRNGGTRCELAGSTNPVRNSRLLLRDQPLYMLASQSMTSPLRISAPVAI